MMRRTNYEISAQFRSQASGPLSLVPNLLAALARARSASTSRSRGSALVTSESSKFRAAILTSSTARLNAASFTCEGLLKPESFLTNCSEASRISSSVAGGSKLNRVLMFLQITLSFFLLYKRNVIAVVGVGDSIAYSFFRQTTGR